MTEKCCMNCEHRGMQYCPFHNGFTGWDDVYCSIWELKVEPRERFSGTRPENECGAGSAPWLEEEKDYA